MGLNAGVGRADITAPVGAHLSGYASRKTPAVGVHDDLCATALYLEQGDVRAAVIAMDLLHLSQDDTDELRRRCERQSGVPAGSVLIACSHTHGGPAMGRGEGDDVRVAYTDYALWSAAGAVMEARHTAQECHIGHGRKEALVACNRRERTPQGVILGAHKDGPRPTAADIVSITPVSGGAPLGVAFAYGCHGTTMGGDNYLVTADYQGVARRFVEREMPGTRGLFLPGCGANQNPYPRGTFEHARQHGTRLGAAAVAGALDAVCASGTAPLVALSARVSLPLQDLPSIDDCHAQLAEAEAAAERERAAARKAAEQAGQEYDPASPLDWFTERRLKAARARLEAAERGETDLTLPVEIQVIGIGDVALLALGGEVFFEIGEAIRERSPWPITIPMAYCNGSVGYVPTAAEAALGGYEVDMARAQWHGLPLRDDADTALIDHAVVLLERARGAGKGA